MPPPVALYGVVINIISHIHPFNAPVRSIVRCFWHYSALIWLLSVPAVDIVTLVMLLVRYSEVTGPDRSSIACLPCHIPTRVDRNCILLLSRKPLIEKGENFWHIKSDIFQFQFLLSIFLHLEQIVQLEVKFEKSASTTCEMLASTPSRQVRAHTFVVKTNHKCASCWTLEHKVDVSTSVFRNIAPFDHPILLKLRM